MLVLEWIVGPKTWLVTVHCERILFWAAVAPSVVHLLPCGTDVKLVALRSDKFTFENTLLLAGCQINLAFYVLFPPAVEIFPAAELTFSL